MSAPDDNDESQELRGPRTPRRRRVLVAEDDADLRAMVVNLLRAEGYEPVACTNGVEACERALSDRPDAVVLDVMMPEMDGFEVLVRLRSQAATRGVPVVMLTARATQRDVAQALANGADRYVVKPFDIDVLLDAIASVLDEPY